VNVMVPPARGPSAGLDPPDLLRVVKMDRSVEECACLLGALIRGSSVGISGLFLERARVNAIGG
jgi:hypothetical protein